MVHISQHYEIAADQIEAIVKKEDHSKPKPYKLEVVTISGHKYETGYADKQERDEEVVRIANRVKEAKILQGIRPFT